MKAEVRIRVKGLRPEKLVQRAMAQGIVFDTIDRNDRHTMTATLSPKDAEAFLSLCRRYRIAAQVLGENGRPVYLKHFRRRTTLPVGVLVFFVLCRLFLSRVWLIDIAFTGPRAASGNAAAVRTCLEASGVQPGMPARRLDTDLLSARLQSELDGFSYIAADIQGIRLWVEAAPETPAPDVYDIGYARDLYSKTDGIVESVLVHSGVACVKPGDVVKRGQVLIRGEERVSDEETRNIAAKGEVRVRTWHEGRACLSMTETVSESTGRRSLASRLRLLDLTFPITDGETFENAAVTRSHLPIVGLYVPLEIVREDVRELKTTTKPADLEILSDHLCALSMADAAVNLTLSGSDPFEIARSWIRFEETDDGMLKACAVYEIYTDAAVTLGALSQGG